MYTQKKKCVDPILELLGLGHLYHGKHPLVWIPDLYPKDKETLKQPTITEHAKPSNPDSNCVREKKCPLWRGTQIKRTQSKRRSGPFPVFP